MNHGTLVPVAMKEQTVLHPKATGLQSGPIAHGAFKGAGEHAEQTHPAAATAAPAPTAAQAGWVQPHRPRRAEVKVGKVVLKLKLVFYLLLETSI